MPEIKSTLEEINSFDGAHLYITKEIISQLEDMSLENSKTEM